MVHDAAAQGYEREAATYRSARPSYHPSVVDRFVASFGRGTIAELGAGTGIFTGQLVDCGLDPIAVEPVAAMRAALIDAIPDSTVVEGTAEATGLDAASVDTVVVAQAFHWFDHAAALAEIGRILRPDGHLVCVWNVRDEAEAWVRAFTEIVDRYAGDTPRHRTMRWRSAIEADPAFDLVDDFAIDNPVPADPQAVAERARSISFIAALEPADQRTVIDDVLALTEPLGPTFDFPYRSELQAWIRRSAS